MPDSLYVVHFTNMRGKCDENIKFYRFPTMKNQQTTERRKKWITVLKSENWHKSEKQVENVRLCCERFVTGDKSDDSLHIDYVPTVFALFLVPRSETEKNETILCVNVEDELQY